MKKNQISDPMSWYLLLALFGGLGRVVVSWRWERHKQQSRSEEFACGCSRPTVGDIFQMVQLRENNGIRFCLISILALRNKTLSYFAGLFQRNKTLSYLVQLVNQIDGERQDQQRKSIKSKFRGTHLLSGLFNWILEMGKTVKSGNLTLFSGVPGQDRTGQDNQHL